MNPLQRVDSSAEAATPATQRAWKAARQFEAQMLEMLLEPVEKGFAGVPGETSDPGAGSLEALGVQALASRMAAAGGIGLAAMVMHKWERRGQLPAEQSPDIRLKFVPGPPMI